VNRRLVLGAAHAAVAAAAFVACSTSVTGLQGPPGPAGPPGAAGSQGEAGAVAATDGGVAKGDSPQVSERAQQGLAISPVPIATAGLTRAEAEQLGQGSYLVNAMGSCSDCHTPASPGPLEYLAGGTAYAVDNGAVVYARNLTPDSKTGMQLSQAQFITAMTTGRDFSDKSGGSILLVMAWSHFRWLSTADLQAIYAYLRAIPPVSNMVMSDNKSASQLNGPPVSAPPSEYDEGDVVRPLPPAVDANGNPVDDPDSVMRGLAIRPLNAPSNAALQAMPADQQAQIGRGAYVANAAQCNDCHTNPPRLGLMPGDADYLHVDTANYLTGGRVFEVPAPLQPKLGQVRTMSTDLTGATNGFLQQPYDSFSRFLSIIESGTHAGGSADGGAGRALGWPMPWQDFRNMTLGDLEALYTYLKTLPPFAGSADKATAAYARYCQAASDCNPGEACSANECSGASCVSDDGGDAEPDAPISKDPCNACQSCVASQCAAPSASDTCLTQGI
jgi:hypothetical protein